MKSTFLPFQTPPTPPQKKKKTEKTLLPTIYTQSAWGTSKCHAFFKDSGAKKKKKKNLHASKTVCVKKIVVSHCGLYLHSEIAFIIIII